MSAAPVQAIEPAGVAAHKLSHPPGDRAVTGSQQQVKVVRQQGPGVTSGLSCTQDRLQPLDEILPVGILSENLAALDPSANDMVQSTRGINAGSAWHAGLIAPCFFKCTT